jgi:hypothetical protein
MIEATLDVAGWLGFYPLHAPLWEICRLRAKPAITAQLLVAAISLSEGRLADVQPIAVWHWLL